MKYLVLFLSFSVFAGNYMSETDIANVKTGNSATTYTRLKRCKVIENDTCHSIDNRNPSYYVPADVEVDDPEKPIYAARTDETDCVLWEPVQGEEPPANACQVLTARVNVGTEEEPVWEYTLCTDKSYYATYADKADYGLGTGYFAYCTKLLGYEQMTIRDLVLNQSLKDAYEASLLDKVKTGKAKRVIDLILIRLAADEVIVHPQASQTLKNIAQALKTEANQELQDLLNL